MVVSIFDITVKSHNRIELRLSPVVVVDFRRQKLMVYMISRKCCFFFSLFS